MFPNVATSKGCSFSKILREMIWVKIFLYRFELLIYPVPFTAVAAEHQCDWLTWIVERQNKLSVKLRWSLERLYPDIKQMLIKHVSLLLPTAYVVRGKVMFSVCSHLGGGGVPEPGPAGGGGYLSQVQLGDTPTGGTPPQVPPPPIRPGWGVPQSGVPPPWVPPSDLAGGYPSGGGTPPQVPPSQT